MVRMMGDGAARRGGWKDNLLPLLPPVTKIRFILKAHAKDANETNRTRRCDRCFMLRSSDDESAPSLPDYSSSNEVFLGSLECESQRMG
jgi:hypothetical protein